MKSWDFLRCKLLLRGNCIYQIVCSVIYYKREREFMSLLRCPLLHEEREFIRLSAMFNITKGNVNSTDGLFCPLIQRRTSLHQIVRVVHYYKREREFIRLSVLFFVKKGIAISSDCLRCSLLLMGTCLQQIACVHY